METMVAQAKKPMLNRVKIKTGYYLELLTPKTMKLLGSTKSKITKDENGEIAIISKIQESCTHLFLINHLVNYYIFHSRKYVKTVNKNLSDKYSQIQMHLELLQKEQFKTQQEQLVI